METIKKLTLHQILLRTAKIHKLDKKVLLKKTRLRKIVICRYHFFKIANEKYFYSLSNIARFVNKDHSTVLYGIKQINNVNGMLTDYNQFVSRFYGIKNEINYYEKKIIETFGDDFLIEYKLTQNNILKQ